MKYTKENIVEGIDARLNELHRNQPGSEHFCQACKIMMQDYPIEIEQNVLEWVNGLPISELDFHGTSIKRVMESRKLTDDFFPIVIKNFKNYKKNEFKGGTYICYLGL